MDVSLVQYSKVKDSSRLFRIDAEYFQSKYLHTEKLIKSKKHSELRTLISLLTDYHANGSYEILRRNVQLLSEPNYAHMLRTVDLERDDFENDIIYIDEHAYNFLTKTEVYGGEIIVNKIGNAGKVYLVPPITNKTSLGMNQFMLRVNDDVDNYCLYCYLSGKYGQHQLQQRITGAVPLSIDKESTRSVLVPIFSDDFQAKINQLVTLHFVKVAETKKLYKQAHNSLLADLGLSNWRPKHQLSFIKKFSNAKQAERIDAEYFQPKHDEIVNAIKTYKGGWDTLDNLVKIKKSIEPGSDAYQESGVPFVRVSNLSKYEITNNNQQYISEELYQSLIEYQPKQNEILLSKDATPGIAFHLKEKPDRMIPSGAILRLTVRNRERPSEEYLTLVLNSTLVQQQILRDAGGSIIKHWRLDQVKKTLIPILGKEKQKEIKSKIEDSFDCRKKSKQLLEIAKQGVEMAIEQDEAMAKEWIQMQIQNLDINLNDEE